ncbi:MAG: excinuclease ABC subunit UvrA [Promethearchaeota archaeon]
MSDDKYITVKGARVHNLKNITVKIPRDKYVVITGLSGSGKSSLAFDTLFAEGQRRYVESLSAYARQFLGRLDKPDVDSIEGLSPAISIDQRSAGGNPRSTVGTITEIYDYMRLLWARIGIPHCHQCGRQISPQSVQQIVRQIMEFEDGKRVRIISPVVRGRKGTYKALFKKLRSEGFIRLRVDGEEYRLDKDTEIELDRYKTHTIEIIVDRLVLKPAVEQRLTQSVETALEFSEGLVTVDVMGDQEYLFSESAGCPVCGISFPDLAPRLFSFNSPYGACPECKGLGYTLEVDPELVVPDPKRSLREGAIVPYRAPLNGWRLRSLTSIANHYGFSLDTPFQDLEPEHQQVLLYGSGDEEIRFEHRGITDSGRKWEWISEKPTMGVIPGLKHRYKYTSSEIVRESILQYMAQLPCPACGGRRLRPEALAVTIHDHSIDQVSDGSIVETLSFFDDLNLTEKETTIAAQTLREIRQRLQFLSSVGLDYLTLNRLSATLAGGEAQRVRLATQIGSRLVGVTYILDEPSIGLHMRDNARLLEMLLQLRDLGNTVLVVEHDEGFIRAADWVIDLGPGAGIHGGQVVAEGTVEEIMENPKSLTGQYLRGDKSITVPPSRRLGNGAALRLKGARHRNLKDIDVTFPLGTFICITGVSGSGKSTLITDTLYPGIIWQFRYRRHRQSDAILAGLTQKPGPFEALEGIDYLDKVILVDQSPIGRTPRSNPATYTKVLDPIRELFAKTEEARKRGYQPGRFSFNVKGGRCETCRGAGVIRIEMQFLPDVYVVCDECHGKRFNKETLQVRYKGKTIYEILRMTVDEAAEFFENFPKIARILKTLQAVGLGYMELGQPSPTLSGGEAQRIKLSRELGKRSTTQTLYILDEPTTGLHLADVQKLLDVLSSLLDAGNTVIVIEHQPDVIRAADYILDLGPEGGDQGGYIVAHGTPEQVAQVKNSHTAAVLRKVLSSKSSRDDSASKKRVKILSQ